MFYQVLNNPLKKANNKVKVPSQARAKMEVQKFKLMLMQLNKKILISRKKIYL